VFGTMTILANITAYRPKLSEEQQKIYELKAYANSTKLPPPDPLDNEDKVTARCIKVINSGFVPLLNKQLKGFSPAAQLQALQVVNSLSQEQIHRAKLAQQGALKLLLQAYDSISSDTQSSPNPAYIAAHALARILISVNPSHALTPPSSAVRPLVFLLNPVESSDGARNLLPVFEALLALTNLASADEETCNTIIRTAWPIIEDEFLLSSNALVQRASVELICNLCASPLGASQFGDGTRAAPRLKTLLALSDADDMATRRAAAGALAMLTEWDSVIDAILALDGGVDRLLRLLKDESEEVVVRGAAALGNCVAARKERVKKIIARPANMKILEDVFQHSGGDVQAAVSEIAKGLS